MKFFSERRWRWILFPALIITLAAVWPGQAGVLPQRAYALPQRAITLLYFQGEGQDNAVFLEWETATEFETAGFIVERATSENGSYTEQIGFIPGEGDGIIGAYYSAIDDVNVVNGQTYWYILVEIENNGNQNPTDPISITAGGATPTATPSRTPTSQPTANSQSTSTPTRTPTPTRTVSPTSPAGATAVPTNTPQPTSASQPGSPSQPTATTANNNAPTNGNSGAGGIAQAAAPGDSPYPPPEGSPSPTFVPDPNQTVTAPEEPESAYPGPGEGPDDSEGAYPSGTDGAENGETAETPAIQPLPQSTGEARPLNTQPPLGQQSGDEAEAAEPGTSNTLFLWIGFAAAMLIFAGGVVGSIFLFARRSNQK